MYVLPLALVLWMGNISHRSSVSLSSGVGPTPTRVEMEGDRPSLMTAANTEPSVKGSAPKPASESGLEPAPAATPEAAPGPEPLPLQLQLQPLHDAALSNLGLDHRLFGEEGFNNDRTALLQSINHSLTYLQTEAGRLAYDQYPVPGITWDRVRRSLMRFRHLVITRASAAALQTAILAEFDFYQSIGNDGVGSVEFTGYFEPTYTASRVPTAEYRYPLYRQPTDLDTWPEPHPTRADLEGRNGLDAGQGPLQGLELVWMRDRLQAFLVQVQGSARLQLTDGTTMSVGYAGRTNYPYTSLGRLLIADGKFSLEELSLPVVLNHFQQHPEDLDHYIPQNDRFIFFQPTNGGPPLGNLNQPVTAHRSIATDKTIMPPGALALIHTELPVGVNLQPQVVSRYVLDQDTGGAIQGPGRVDIFMGTGDAAGDRAGLTHSTGQLYYLLLK